jgi:hypothetical protein
MVFLLNQQSNVHRQDDVILTSLKQPVTDVSEGSVPDVDITEMIDAKPTAGDRSLNGGIGHRQPGSRLSYDRRCRQNGRADRRGPNP